MPEQGASGRQSAPYTGKQVAAPRLARGTGTLAQPSDSQ